MPVHFVFIAQVDFSQEISPKSLYLWSLPRHLPLSHTYICVLEKAGDWIGKEIKERKEEREVGSGRINKTTIEAKKEHRVFYISGALSVPTPPPLLAPQGEQSDLTPLAGQSEVLLVRASASQL